MDYEAVLILATLRESQAERLQQNPPPTAIRGPGSGPLLGQSPAIAGGRTPQVPGDTPVARPLAAGGSHLGSMKFLTLMPLPKTPCCVVPLVEEDRRPTFKCGRYSRKSTEFSKDKCPIFLQENPFAESPSRVTHLYSELLLLIL